MARIISMVAALVFLLGAAKLTGEEKPLRSISVAGTVETKTAPDQIVWWITLTDVDKSLREAKRKSDDKVREIVALREKLGIGEGDLETGQLRVRRERDKGDFKSFTVTRRVTILEQDLKRFDQFLDILFSSAGMEVGFTFESSKIYEVRAQTRLQALQAARDKAEAMAKVVGAKLGRAVTISEFPSGGWQGALGPNREIVESTPAADLATQKFAPDAISVQVTVYATFELE